MEGSVESRREGKSKKKKKKLQVDMEVLSETADRISPLVGYFPSGYNPEGEQQPPDIKVLRNRRRTNRLELVVSPSDSNVQFVGRSYAGEAATPQLCTYALGVFDKESQSLKIVPIAANKIFRLEPRVIKKRTADEDVGEVLAEEGVVGRRMADLTSIYGTKKDRDRDNKRRLLNEQKRDHAAQEKIEGQKPEDETQEAPEDAKLKTVHNIPPHDPSAVTPEKAYLLDEIIPKGERRHLLDILEIVHSGEEFTSSTKFWQENGYPSFVFKRISKLKAIKDEKEVENLACILSYITHLINFMGAANKTRFTASSFLGSDGGQYNIPRIIYQKFMKMFVDPESCKLSTEKRELLIGYVLVLTLFVDEFQTDPSDISKDLKMAYGELKPYFLQLGCKAVRDVKFKIFPMTLPVPLDFPDLSKRKRRRQ